MWWRIFYGVLRTMLGLALLQVVDVPFTDILYRLLGRELIEDPQDALFMIVHSFLQVHPITVTYFLSAYLLFWGFIDIVLSIQMLRKKMWAFPVSMYLIALFVSYELYRLIHTHSRILLFVIVIDILVLWIIHREYTKMRRCDQ